MPFPIIPLALAFGVGSALLQGAAARSDAKASQRQNQRNAYIARTRALQQDAYDRRSLADELATMRTTFAANDQGQNVGTFEMYRSLRDMRERERKVNFQNRILEQADFQTAARNDGRQATWGFFGGLARAGQSIFDLYQVM